MTDNFAIRHRATAVLIELAEHEDIHPGDRIYAADMILIDERGHRELDLQAQNIAQLEANERAMEENREAVDKLREAIESE